MPLPLEITLIVVLLAVGAAVVPLLLQLRRTAKEAEVLMHSAKQELTRLAEDAHASNRRVESLGASLQVSLDEFAGLARALGDTGRMVKAFQVQCQSGLDSASRVFSSVLGGLEAVRALFGHKSQPAQNEQEPPRDFEGQ